MFSRTLGSVGEEMKKRILILIAVLIFNYACAETVMTRRGEIVPAPPSAQAIWVYGHYDLQGKWVPGHWVE